VSHAADRIRCPARGSWRLAIAAAFLVPATASADVVVMTTGSRIACTRAVPDAGRIRIELTNGGQLHVAPEAVKRIEAGSGSGSGSRGLVLSASSAADGVAGSGFGDGSSPTVGRSGGRAAQPVEAEVAYGNGAERGQSQVLPSGLVDVGNDPVPTEAELRAGDGQAPLDPRRQAWANRSRLSPGSAGGLMSRPGGGAGARGGWRGDTANEPPRVGR
jgi:hypothetical protein